MWPSEEVASKIYSLANWGIIAGLVLGIVSTVMLVWMGNVKEWYLKKELSDTKERTAGIESSNIQLGTALELQKGASRQSGISSW